MAMAIAVSGFGQSNLLRKARQQKEDLDLQGAILTYLKLLEKNQHVGATEELADCYRLTGQATEAAYWYEQAVRSPKSKAISQLYLGQMLQRIGRCDLAMTWLQSYLQRHPDDRRAKNRLIGCEQIGELRQRGAGFFDVSSVPFNSTYHDFSPVYFEEGLLFSSDRPRETMIVREQTWSEGAFTALYLAEKGGASSETCPPAGFAPPEAIEALDKRFHESTASFCPRTRELFFTANPWKWGTDVRDDTGLARQQIFSSLYLGDGLWSEPISWELNSHEYSMVHPAISPDGQVMIFAADIPGGFGGMDLYYSERRNDHWLPAVNLGPELNTEGNELFPFYHESGRLYFASDGLPGMGGLDLFWVQLDQFQQLEEPFNPGAPLNSSADDFGIFWDADLKCGWLSSNRSGGMGKDDIYAIQSISTTLEMIVVEEGRGRRIEGAEFRLDCQSEKLLSDATGRVQLELKRYDCCTINITAEGYDAVQINRCTHNLPAGETQREEIVLTKTSELLIEGVVFDQGTGLPVEDVQVKLENLCDGSEQVFLTNLTGRYEFLLSVECCYNLVATKTRFLAGVAREICAQDLNLKDKNRANLYLQPLVFKGNNMIPGESSGFMGLTRENPSDPSLNKGPRIANLASLHVGGRTRPGRNEPIPFLLDIYYDFNSTAILPEAFPEMNKLFQTLRDNPDIVIEIGSHTDAIGSSRYNQKLSQRRAEAVVRWLVEKGVRRSRLIAKGYGESRLLNRCDDGVPCSDAEHRINRRTEFRVIGCKGCEF
jgi:outer membrane protein OmpA-like peptidoglycan-associated protein/tetratricopeptide (TPR) repeat protein